MRRSTVVLAVALAVLPAPPVVLASGGANDEDVQTLIAALLAGDYAQGRPADALEKLGAAQALCEGDGCSKRVRAELHVAMGTVEAGGLHDAAAARRSFEKALALDPQVQLPAGHAEPAVQALFDETKGARSSAPQAACSQAFTGGATPPGWRDAEAAFCSERARKQRDDGAFAPCAADARSSLEREARLGTRDVLASCLEGADHWAEAIVEYDELARLAPKQGQFALSRRAANKAAQLRRRMPVLVLTVPHDVEGLVVSIDGNPLSADELTDEIVVDPGRHVVTAEGKSKGLALNFEQEVELGPDKTVTVPIRLAPGPPKWATRDELACMLESKSADEFTRCLDNRGTQGGDLRYRVGVEVSGYHDDMHVDVVTPAASGSIEDGASGWGVGASVIVDVVSAASVDIVATASPRWREVREAPALHAHKRWDPVDVGLHAALSHEPDYLATAVGADVSVDLEQKTITPSFGYEFGYDVAGRSDTPWEVYKNEIMRHALTAGLGLVASKDTFVSGNVTAVFESGDTSKPYRYVPFFSEADAPNVPKGLTVEAVNQFRLPIRALEQLPADRQRYALAFQLAHRFSDSTLRVSERVYGDSWRLFASTTDVRYLVDVGDIARLWPHVRFHGQGAAAFYRLAYPAAVGADGVLRLPTYRTGDRELGPLVALTLGGGGRLDLGERKQFGLSLTADFVYTAFLDHLYVRRRLGGFGALSFEMELE